MNIAFEEYRKYSDSHFVIVSNELITLGVILGVQKFLSMLQRFSTRS